MGLHLLTPALRIHEQSPLVRHAAPAGRQSIACVHTPPVSSARDRGLWVATRQQCVCGAGASKRRVSAAGIGAEPDGRTGCGRERDAVNARVRNQGAEAASMGCDVGRKHSGQCTRMATCDSCVSTSALDERGCSFGRFGSRRRSNCLMSIRYAEGSSRDPVGPVPGLGAASARPVDFEGPATLRRRGGAYPARERRDP